MSGGRLKRAGQIAQAVEADLGSRYAFDVEQLIASGFNWCRYLPPLAISSDIVTLSSWTRREPYFTHFANGTLAVDTILRVTASDKVCLLVRQLNVRWRQVTGAAGTLQVIQGVEQPSTTSRAEIAGFDLATRGNYQYERDIWIPPSWTWAVTLDYTGGGAGVDELSVTAGAIVYAFPAGMFPLC